MTLLNEGFIRLVDSLGTDRAIVQSARVSYGQESKGDKADKGLINYLMKHNHGTPFEHVMFTFHIKCPLFVARQWFRHRIGSFNEISGRYVKVKTEFWIPDEWRINDTANHQASSPGQHTASEIAKMYEIYQTALDTSKQAYDSLLEMGVAREQARGVLPLATYTEFYWSVNLRSLFNFLKLRSSSDAQTEIRVYAEEIFNLIEDKVPWALEAFRTAAKI